MTITPTRMRNRKRSVIYSQNSSDLAQSLGSGCLPILHRVGCRFETLRLKPWEPYQEKLRIGFIWGDKDET